MSMDTAIEWTDATWNPTTGCTKISPGCAHCYIERTPPFRISGRRFVKGATDLRLHDNRLDAPLHWRRPRRVFVNSLSDLYHDGIPFAFVQQVFRTMLWFCGTASQRAERTDVPSAVLLEARSRPEDLARHRPD